MIPKILCINFYTNNLLFCDEYYTNDENPVPESGMVFKRKECYTPLFYEDLKLQIKTNKPELLIINTHGDNEKSYLHTDFLPNYLNGYTLLHHHEFKSMNMSAYVENTYYYNYEYIKSDQYLIGNQIETIALYIKSDFGNLAFMGVNRSESLSNLTEDGFEKLIKETLKLYVDNTDVQFYFILSHLKGLPYTHYHNFNNSYQLNSSYNIDQVENTYVETQSDHDMLFTLYEVTAKNKTILCFSWNTDKIPLCDQMYSGAMNVHQRKRFFSDTTCYNPVFFNQIKEEISLYNPFVVALTNEGDLEKGTFFHYEFLPAEMKKLNYILLENDKVNHIGDKYDNETMRLSIYVRNDITNVKLEHINRSVFSYNETSSCDKAHFLRTNNEKDKIMSKTKAIAKYVKSPEGIIAFVALQIPEGTTPDNANHCLRKIKKDLLSSGKISHIFLMGDFAYPNKITKYQNEFIFGELEYEYKYKELETYETGPYVYPNYKLKSLEISQYQNFELNDNRYENNDDLNMTWHDRIYYTSKDMSTTEVTCVKYENVMGFPMLSKLNEKSSHHIGILGVYEIQKIDLEKSF